MKATGIDAIFFSVRDVANASTFYRGLLDIRETTFEMDFGAEYVLADGSAFGFGRVPGKEHVPSGCVLFAVANVEESTKLVTGLGGKLNGELRDLPPCRQQWCEDPDGNAFVLHQRK